MKLSHVVLSALLLSSSMVHADNIGWGDGSRPGEQNGRNRPRPEDPRRPSEPTRPSDPWENNDPWGNQNDREDRRVELQVRQYFQGRSTLDLVSDQYIRSQLRGHSLRNIKIVASTQGGNGHASLLLNGLSIDGSQEVERQMATYTFRVDPRNNDIGKDLKRIELSMQGKFYVEKVIFNLLEDSGPNGPGPSRPPEGPTAEVVRQQLNERIQQEGGLELFRMFNLANERRGQSVSKVTVLARSQFGFAQASLMVNNQQTGIAQTVSNSVRLTFDLANGMRIGQEIQGLRLYFRGDVVIEEVSIEFDRRGGGNNGPIPPMERRIEQVVNQRLYDTNGVSLSQLMQIPARLEDRVVESVELTLRNSDIGVTLKLCQVVQDRISTVNCAAPVRIFSGAQVVTLTGVNLARLRDTQLSTRMGMIDIDRIAITLR